MKHLVFGLLLFFFAATGEAQRISIFVYYNPTTPIGPEHGFLGGKKFKIYPAVGKYDLHGTRLRIELHDVRDSLKLTKADCFSVEMTNTSELEGPYGAHAVWKTYTRSYCVDITDKDPHSPIGSHAFVTRKTATRVIASAAIREAVEKAMTDLEFDK